MKPNATLIQEASGRTIKRAQFEAFEFGIDAPGLVRVTNGSYGTDAENHSYRVNVEDGAPTACECNAFEYREGACKHMLAVAIRTPVLDAARAYESTQPEPARVRADGSKPIGTEDTDACENGQAGCCGPDSDDLPCFECYTIGAGDGTGGDR
jgi:hypothetical protein